MKETTRLALSRAIELLENLIEEAKHPSDLRVILADNVERRLEQILALLLEEEEEV